MTVGKSKSNAPITTDSKPRIFKRRSSLVGSTVALMSSATLSESGTAHHSQRCGQRCGGNCRNCTSSMDRASPAAASIDGSDHRGGIAASSQYDGNNRVDDEGNNSDGSWSDTSSRSGDLAERMTTEVSVGSGVPRRSVGRYEARGDEEDGEPGPGNHGRHLSVVSNSSSVGGVSTDVAAVAPEARRPRRTSMSNTQQAERRSSIRTIMADLSLTPLERRKSIQSLMDGRRHSMDCGTTNPYLAQAEAAAKALREQQEALREQQEALAHQFHAQQQSRDQCHPCGNNGAHPTPMDLTDDDSFRDNGGSSPNLSSKKHPYAARTTVVPAVAASAFASSSAKPSAAARHASIERSRRAIETVAPPCDHYQRNCHIVSPCCGATFGCRICHDDCPVLPPLLGDEGGAAEGGMAAAASSGIRGRKHQRTIGRSSSMPMNLQNIPAPEHHTLDRFATREIICRVCFERQSSKTNNCINCGIQFGEYHCAICNLWMSNEERPYHCPDCGFCRVGGGENFRHCQDCGMCIDKELFANHNCKVGKYMSNCPVCQEDLFSSRDASHELPCGHAIHWHCFRELASHDSRCPMCKKTAETHERMKPTWDAMAEGIALQPVPPDLAKVVTMKCNDCERVQKNRSWHFLGVQCRQCESFNTVVERITMMGPEAHEFLMLVDPPLQHMAQEAHERQYQDYQEQERQYQQQQGQEDPQQSEQGQDASSANAASSSPSRAWLYE